MECTASHKNSFKWWVKDDTLHYDIHTDINFDSTTSFNQ